MSEPLITTILPTYRRPDLLKRAVYSVLNQTERRFIVRIMDNASGDSTGGVARELMAADARMQYHCHPENVGSLNNMIAGMDSVTTPYFNILCDDDVLMPEFFASALRVHEAAATPLAFVAGRVVVVDHHQRFADPWSFPEEECTMPAPEGVSRLVKHGVSLTGLVYRTPLIRAIGPPRVPWWNWTESGWNALVAISHPIAFTPGVSAILFNHPGSNSKKMDHIEFRSTWFRMVAEVRKTAMRAGVSPEWWDREMTPHVSKRFVGTVSRLCNRDGMKAYRELAGNAAASGVGTMTVRAVIALARLAGAAGLGPLANRLFDDRQARARAAAAPGEARPDDSGLSAAAAVFASLNRQAGLP